MAYTHPGDLPGGSNGGGSSGPSAADIGTAVDQELKATPQDVAGTLLERIADAAEDTNPVPVTLSFGTDSNGDPLPSNFDTLAESYTYSSGQVSTIAKASGGDTYTQTFSYTEGQLTGVSQWVKS